MDRLIEWLEAHQLPCYYKQILGIECLGCGMQSAFILLLKGDLADSFAAYPALIPFMGFLVFLVLHLIFKFRKGTVILKISFIFTLTIMVAGYIFHLVKH